MIKGLKRIFGPKTKLYIVAIGEGQSIVFRVSLAERDVPRLLAAFSDGELDDLNVTAITIRRNSEKAVAAQFPQRQSHFQARSASSRRIPIGRDQPLPESIGRTPQTWPDPEELHALLITQLQLPVPKGFKIYLQRIMRHSRARKGLGTAQRSFLSLIRRHLDPDERQLFDLSAQGLTWNQISQKLDEPPGKLRSRLRRAVATAFNDVKSQIAGSQPPEEE